MFCPFQSWPMGGAGGIANFPSELYNSVVLLETVVNAVSGLIAPGYKALGCDVNFPDAAGSDATRQWQDHMNKYLCGACEDRGSWEWMVQETVGI